MKKMQPLDLILFVAKCRAAATLRRYDNKCGHCHCQLQFIKKFANHTKNEQKHLAPLSTGVSAYRHKFATRSGEGREMSDSSPQMKAPGAKP